MSDKCSLNRFLGCVYGYTFFNALLFLEPVYAVFMQSHGVSDFGISVLLIILGVCALLFGHRRASSYCNRCTICDDVPSTTIRPCGCEII